MLLDIMQPENQDKRFSQLLMQLPKPVTPEQKQVSPAMPVAQTSSQPEAKKQSQTSGIADASIKGAANLTKGFMDAMATQQATNRQVQQQTAQQSSQALQDLNSERLKGLVNPLSALISNYRTSIG